MENINHLCRTCGMSTREECRQSIFEIEGSLNKIPLKLSILPIQITQSDPLPKVMCDACVYKLDITYDFIMKIKSTQNHFNNLIQYQGTVIKVEPDICAYSQVNGTEHSSDCQIVNTHTVEKNSINFKEESIEGVRFGTHFLGAQRQVLSQPYITMYHAAHSSTAQTEVQKDIPNHPPPVYDIEPDSANTYQSPPVNSATPPLFYLCRFCRLPFPSHEAADEHIHEVHKKDEEVKLLKESQFESSTISQRNPYKSETENKASTSKLKKCIKESPEYVSSFHACTSCYIVFPSIESLSLHMKNHKSLPECKMCGVKFTSDESLANHKKKDEHTVCSLQESKMWRCSECGKKCRKRCKIQNHMRVHTKERPYTCNFCPKAFPIKAQLTMHERKHNNDWCYICNYCGKGFYVKVYFDNHVRTVHTKEKPFKCDKCDSCYASKASLKEHIISKHNDGTLPIKIYECKSCGKKFKDNNSLYYHNKTHAATLEERRKHKCLVCNASFVKNHYLRKHMRKHTGENIERFECHLCGKKLATSHGLELHLVIHSGVKNFICDFCGKAFASESTLKTHIRCHTGEKPYQCRVCSNFFTQRSSLLSHLKNIHNIDDRIRKIKFNQN